MKTILKPTKIKLTPTKKQWFQLKRKKKFANPDTKYTKSSKFQRALLKGILTIPPAGVSSLIVIDTIYSTN